MALVAASTDRERHTRKQVLGRLEFWARALKRARDAQDVVAEHEALVTLDRWLDELSALAGRR